MRTDRSRPDAGHDLSLARPVTNCASSLFRAGSARRTRRHLSPSSAERSSRSIAKITTYGPSHSKPNRRKFVSALAAQLREERRYQTRGLAAAASRARDRLGAQPRATTAPRTQSTRGDCDATHHLPLRPNSPKYWTATSDCAAVADYWTSTCCSVKPFRCYAMSLKCSPRFATAIARCTSTRPKT
jgi:hypothetical protein